MTNRVLERLKSEEFAISVGVLVPSPPLRRVLLGTKEVRDIVFALRQGALSENQLLDFVSECMAELRKGERFPYDLAFSALAVVLERRPTHFAEEFLDDLARLKLAEMPSSIRIARECLKHRFTLAETRRKTQMIGAPLEAGPVLKNNVSGDRVNGILANCYAISEVA